jgi:hypothetical protein
MPQDEIVHGVRIDSPPGIDAYSWNIDRIDQHRRNIGLDRDDRQPAANSDIDA